MIFINMKYQVVVESYTERHFIKSFAKKYPGAWDKTLKGLLLEFMYVDLLFKTQIAEKISVSHDNNVEICKTEFKIIGTNISRHASGYRCIIAIHKSTMAVHVLLVYGKGDISGSNETTWWKQVIKDNYSQYDKL